MANPATPANTNIRIVSNTNETECAAKIKAPPNLDRIHVIAHNANTSGAMNPYKNKRTTMTTDRALTFGLLSATSNSGLQYVRRRVNQIHITGGKLQTTA